MQLEQVRVSRAARNPIPARFTQKIISRAGTRTTLRVTAITEQQNANRTSRPDVAGPMSKERSASGGQE